MQDRGLGVVLAGEDVLGVVEAGAREPLGAGHLAAAEGALDLAVGLDAEEVPDRGPEGLEVGDRPAPELVVAVEAQSALGRQASA